MSSTLKLQVVLQALDKATAPIRGLSKSIEKLNAQQNESTKLLKRLENQQAAINSFRELSKATSQSGAAMAEQQQKVKALAQQIQATEQPSKKLTREFNSATREAARLKQAHTGNQQKLQGLRNDLARAKISTTNLSDAEIKLRSKIAETNKAIERQGDSYKRLNKIKEQHDKLNEQHGKEMHRIAMLGAVGDEVYLRESIIAAYYAVFHECRLLAERLANHAGMGARSGSHAEVISKLSKYPANNAEQLPTK